MDRRASGSRQRSLPAADGLLRLIVSGLCAVAALMASATPAAAETEIGVNLELVLAVDVSSSVDVGEYRLQAQGLAWAFRDLRVRAAIRRHAPGGIAVTVIQWAAGREQAVALDWTWLSTEASVEAFAARLATMPRAFVGTDTVIAGAIEFGVRRMQANAYRAVRRVIDVSGDGGAEGLGLASLARDGAVAAGIVVNGLAIENEVPNLREYFRDHVIGGKDAFALSAAGYEDFAETMRRKLIREIGEPPLALATAP